MSGTELSVRAERLRTGDCPITPAFSKCTALFGICNRDNSSHLPREKIKTTESTKSRRNCIKAKESKTTTTKKSLQVEIKPGISAKQKQACILEVQFYYFFVYSGIDIPFSHFTIKKISILF